MSPSRSLLLLCCSALCGACLRSPSESLEAHFPAVAARVLASNRGELVIADGRTAPPPRRSLGLGLVLPSTPDAPARLDLGPSLSVELRELELEGVAQRQGGAVVYEGRKGRSFWSATSSGYEEWIERFDAGEGPIAEWELVGATFRAVEGGAVMVEDAQGLGRVRITAPAAWGADGRQGRAWLRVEGPRLALFTDLRGHVLVDPAWTATGSLPVAAAFVTITQLPDGTLLATGGESKAGASSITTDSAGRYDPNTGTWVSVPMGTARQSHTATLLKTGKVLVTGGFNRTGGMSNATCELFDPATNTWGVPTTCLRAERSGHTATLLGSGKVLLVGGTPSAGAAQGSVDLYDPTTGTSTATGALTTGRAGHRAVRLQDGTVLAISGGSPVVASVERYSPATGTWSAAGALATARAEFTATVLPAGDVLVTGGSNSAFATVATCERYSPATNTWSSTGSLVTARRAHAAVLLTNGTVLVAGGFGAGSLQSTEIYDPTSALWTAGSLLTQQHGFTSAGLLPNGKAIVAGGIDAGGYSLTAEVYDLASTGGTFAATGALATPRTDGAMVLLPSGSVLAMGGSNAAGVVLPTAEIYSPATGAWAATGSMTTARKLFAAALLPSGKVLVAGGSDGTNVLTGAELYDPATGTWTATGSLATARRELTLTTRGDGSVVAIGGINASNALATYETYAQETGTWSAGATGMPSGHRGHSATLLGDDSVLVAFGYTNSGTSLSSSVVILSSSGMWATVSGTVVGRAEHTATLLPNQRIVFAGGVVSGTASSQVALYDPLTSTLAAQGPGVGLVMPNAQAGAGAVLLPNGKVLVAGGSNVGGVVGVTSLYDPELRTWSAGPSLATARKTPMATVLPSGKVLFAGGATTGPVASVAAEVYDEGRGAQPGWTPSITTAPVSIAPGATLSLSGTLFEGVSEGGRGGVDHFSSGSPLLRLRSAENERRPWLTATTWTGTTLSATMPSSIPTGLYWLSVTVNGVPSLERSIQYFVPVVAAPAAATKAPRTTQTFTATGGTGVFGWSLATNASGGSITGAGAYTAGATGSVSDVVRVTDGQGRSATATVTVSAGVSLSPATVSKAPRATQAFAASGGTGTGFAYSLVTNNSGASITDGGVYAAGPTGSVTDVVRVTDAALNTADATVTVTAGASITPALAAVAPRGTRTFNAVGGSGTGFTFSLLTNNSGGTITGAGAYTAGATPNVADTIRVTDSLGNTATATANVGSGVIITPSSASTPPLGTRAFSASGGSGTGYAWSLPTNASGGSIVVGSGAYTAGATQGTDVVSVVDSFGNTTTAQVIVTSGLSINPPTNLVSPRAVVPLTAAGGSGVGYTWVLVTNNSGGTLVPSGLMGATYTAGPTPFVTDTARVTDSLGNQAVATLNVAGGVIITPLTSTVPPRGSRAFTASGGSNMSFSWSLATNPSGGSIGAGSGVYQAGATGNVTDVVQVVDLLGNTATAMISTSAGVSITPALPAVAPNGSALLAAAGGSGTGYTWTVTSVPSNGTINGNTGEYRAGGVGGVTDTVRVVDSLGNEATVTVTIAGGLTIMPASPTLAPRARQTFTAVGGSGADYVWSMVTATSGGTIDATTGQYQAGPTGGVFDTIEVHDSLRNSARTTVTLTDALSLTPAAGNVPPRGSLTFTAAGGSGAKTFSMRTNGSGGAIHPTTGVYAAGPAPGVTDEVVVTDEFNATAAATLTVTAGITVTPSTLTVPPSGTKTFTAAGGSNTGFTWTLESSASGGTIDATTGDYVAGGAGGVNDVVLVTDSVGNTAIATVSVIAGASTVSAVPFSQRDPVSGWSCGCGASGGDGGLFSLLALVVFAARRRSRAVAGLALAVCLAAPALSLAAPAKRKSPVPAKQVAVPPEPAPVAPASIAPAPAPEPGRAAASDKPSLAVLDVVLTVPNESLDGQSFTEMVVNSIEGTGHFTVMSARDMATMLGLERQKQLLGCSDDSSCMAEIASAMGSNLVLQAGVGKVGDTYLVTVKMVDGRSSRIVGRAALQTQQANALLGTVWRATQQALDSFAATLPPEQAARWSARPKPQPPAAITAEAPVPNFFGITLLAVGGLQVLSEAGRRGSLGAEVDLTFRRGRLDLGAGVIIGPNIGARIAAAWALIDTRFRLGVGVRGTAYPGLSLFGGGLGVNLEFALNQVFGLTAIGAAEIYSAPVTPVVALLLSLGATARF